ncbi:UvrD-helicase domain-containing protein [Thermus sediminis]|uniref:UvrD-helicase domain-containing protein n=1 Tax=Thermus sediminis TaxID=1761908 RepID=UPI000E3D579F|nr:UvrD-helicase domain-containing protein [Thermus sediminis]
MRVYVASAGTGKTQALVEELEGLLRRGVPLRRIAALTFTRKAAEELRRRAQEAVLGLAGMPHLEEAKREVHGALFTTIHGFMAEALRHTAPLLSLDPDFAVMDELLAEALFLEEVRSRLYLKGLDGGWDGLLLTLYRKRTLAERLYPLPGAEAVFALFEEALEGYRRRAWAALGPSDLEALALRLLENREALRRVVERFPFILLDEYQDTGPLQGRFFRGLEEAGAEVVAVGDPKQSIYLFRNARVEVFREAMGGAEEVRRLGRTYRHARRVAAFLNRFVALFGEGEGVGVEVVREEEGRVEVHWVVGGKDLEERRRTEAALLAQRLLALAEEGYPFQGMAVLVRSRTSFPHLEEAFRARGVPYGLRRGRSFFTRPEVRDLYHALRLILLEGSPGPEERLSLLAFLRGPWVGLDLAQVERALGKPDPIPLLPEEVQKKLLELRQLAGLPPLEALKRLAREETFLKRLSPRARANVDTLLLLAAMERFPDLETLLDWLQIRARDPEASELPEGAEGVNLLTVHGAKGLEWPVVALFDLSRGERFQEEPLLVGLRGEVALGGAPAFAEVRRTLKGAQEEEALRLLYVALSRARDVLVVTGSATDRPTPWVEAMVGLGIGPGSQDPLVRHHNVGAFPPPAPPPDPPPPPVPAPYAHLSFPKRPLPSVLSPSAYRKLQEPLPLAEALEKEALPEFPRALGTLVHYAIARHLDPEDEGAMAGLLLQEVAFPFAGEERRRLLEEVKDLLRRYRGMLGPSLVPLEEREEDHAELPLVLPLRGTVWYGVLDRLYRVGGRWYLEDYKTDHEVRPEAYRLQLALYRRALLEAWGVEAEARLVYLRHALVHPFLPEELEMALKDISPGEAPGEGV